MKIIVSIFSILLISSLFTSCTSTKRKNECKVTCLAVNERYDDVNRPGCICQEKENKAERLFDMGIN